MPTHILPMTLPACDCCPTPLALVPRPDLPGGLSVCPASGQLYRPTGEGFVRAPLPELPARETPAPVQVDLSRSGYA